MMKKKRYIAWIWIIIQRSEYRILMEWWDWIMWKLQKSSDTNQWTSNCIKSGVTTTMFIFSFDSTAKVMWTPAPYEINEPTIQKSHHCETKRKVHWSYVKIIHHYPMLSTMRPWKPSQQQRFFSIFIDRSWTKQSITSFEVLKHTYFVIWNRLFAVEKL